MAKNRHDFTVQTVVILGKRVGLKCSNPGCAKPTSGPHADPEKATIVGIAAHITAASPGGPRYDAKMSEKERRSASNGIWLCANCSVLIDKNPAEFDVPLLQKWKTTSEKHIEDELKGRIANSKQEERLAHIELDLIWIGNVRANRGLSEKMKEAYGNGPIIAGTPTINHYRLDWIYNLVAINNSSYNAYNIEIKPRIAGLEFEKLPARNNLAALAAIEKEARFVRGFEGTFIEADELMKNDIPKDLVGTLYDVFYTDDTRKSHQITFVLTETGFVESN